MKRSTIKLLSVLNIIAMILLVFLLRDFKPMVIICGIVCLIIQFVLEYLLRCPHCGRWPRKGDWMDEYCPRCGNPLDKE